MTSEHKPILGIGPLSPPITGPGIKNRHLKSGLSDMGVEIDWINTLNLSPSKIISIIRKLGSSIQFIISASTKVRLIASFALYPKLLKSDSRAIMLPMGGQLHEEIRTLPAPVSAMYKKCLSQLDFIAPETNILSSSLRSVIGPEVDVITIPNLRSLPNGRPEVEVKSGPIQATYVGRIKEKKGVSDAIQAVQRLNQYEERISFDIYGQFLEGDNYKEEFLESCEKTKSVSYNGRIPDGEVMNTLMDYDIFIFPSYYEGEGFPGALIEAYMSGCIVIATNWNSNGEIVIHEKTGLLYNPRDVSDLYKNLKHICERPKKLTRMKKNALELSHQYSVEEVTSSLYRELINRGWNV